jgi:hypothetical protein
LEIKVGNIYKKKVLSEISEYWQPNYIVITAIELDIIENIVVFEDVQEYCLSRPRKRYIKDVCSLYVEVK